MELKVVEDAYELPGKLREDLIGLGRWIKKHGAVFKQKKEAPSTKTR